MANNPRYKENKGDCNCGHGYVNHWESETDLLEVYQHCQGCCYGGCGCKLYAPYTLATEEDFWKEFHSG